MRKDAQGRRLCQGSTKAGNPCRAPAVSGATVCRLHGAAKGTPAREAADRVLLEQLIAPALMRLKGLVENPETSDAVALAAIKEVLNRTDYSEVRRLTEEDIEREIELREAEQAGWTLAPEHRKHEN